MHGRPKPFYRQRLPHLQPQNGLFFVTSMLENSLPKSAIWELKEEFSYRKALLNSSPEKRNHLNHLRLTQWYLNAYAKALHQLETGDHFLIEPEIANILADQFFRFDGKLYDLQCFCIMSNHFHLVIDTFLPNQEKSSELDRIMKRIKGASSRLINLKLGRTGQLWKRESYDRLVRNEREYWNIVNYTLNNPVKANLVTDWADWPYSFWKYDGITNKHPELKKNQTINDPLQSRKPYQQRNAVLLFP